jgi:DNA helicase HerA-like ATPase
VTNDILLGKGTAQVYLHGSYANRHGLIAGATGTGKTVTLMVLAEGFSRMGVPVFIADVKGDVAGLAAAGTSNPKIAERVAEIGVEGYVNEANPVVFWDLYGKQGHPVRTTVSEMGPTLLSRILELNDTQSGVVDVAFKLADDKGLLLLDFADLRALLGFITDHRKEVSAAYGLVSASSVAAIQRALLSIARDGGEQIFGEPALDLEDFMRSNASGRGLINILVADTLTLKPRLYSTFLLWLLSELFERLPEVGDLDKPKLVFMFDEAHLLFDDATPALKQRVEQVVRIIRSKGIGVYFCSQFPDDVPDDILGQLGNRVQHALRAFTPRDQKAVRTAAETFVPNPALDVAATIGKLGVGEALVSTLQDKGVPMPVERTTIAPPRCRIGAITGEERAAVRVRSPIGRKYDASLNRESAYEVLTRRASEISATPPPAAPVPGGPPAATPAPPSTTSPTAQPEAHSALGSKINEWLFGTSRRQGMVETMAKQAARTVGSQVGRQILRGVLGGVLGGVGGSKGRR